METTEQTQYQSTAGFLFGAGSTAGALDVAYNSIFLDDKASDFTFDVNEKDQTPPSSKPTTRARVRFFNFAAPFARYFFAIKSADLLLKLGKLIPTILPSTAHLKTTYLSIAATILVLDFICLALRSLQWFPNTAPFINPTISAGRNMLRRFGRRGWYLWYLSQPFRLLITITSALLIVGLLALAGHSIHTEASSPTTVTPALLQAVKWSRNLLFVFSMSTLISTALNYMLEKNWTKWAVTSVFLFGFTAIASLIISLGTALPEPPVFLTQ